MSALMLRNNEGVILDYGDPGALKPFHTDQKRYPSDLKRTAVIKAERELAVLRIIVEHLDLSGIARTRISHALDIIGGALRIERHRVDLGQVTDVN